MCRVVWAGVTLFEMATACALAIISGKIIFIFAFVAPCGALQTHFHGRGRDGDSGICCTRSPAGSCRAATEGPANRRSEKKCVERSGWHFFVSTSALGLSRASSPLFATATTAASGGYREELLGQRPAGCECRPRHEADAGCRNPSGPARRNRRALAALNTRHLLRKPVCGLKAPLGLSCPPGTAVLSSSLLCGKREHIRRRCFS